MAQTATRKLWASGKLTTIDNSSLSSLEQSCVCPLGLAHFAHLIWPTLSY